MLQNEPSSPAQPDHSHRAMGQAESPPEEISADHQSSPYPSSYSAANQSPPYHYAPQRHANGGARAGQLAQALGWFSIGLGVAQLLAPRRLSRAVGAPEQATLMRACGAREIASGVGILTQRRSTPWLWSRVAGDAFDLALLGAAARSREARRNRIGLVSAAVTGIAVLDLLTSMNAQQDESVGQSGQVEFQKSIIVNRSPEECYQYWHDFENLPHFMRHLESVQVIDDRHSLWKAKGPLGFNAEWTAELSADEPGQYLAWRSVADSEIDNAGSVRFTRMSGNRGTIVQVEMRYSPPGGAAGSMIARLFGEEPSQQIDEDLRRFKWLIETGEIPTTVGQPSGARGAMNRLLFRKGAPG